MEIGSSGRYGQECDRDVKRARFVVVCGETTGLIRVLLIIHDRSPSRDMNYASQFELFYVMRIFAKHATTTTVVHADATRECDLFQFMFFSLLIRACSADTESSWN